MNQDSIDSLKNIFRFVLELAPDVDVESINQNDTPKWDSMAQVSLVAGIESEFDLQLELSEALRITSFAIAVQLLKEKLGS